MFLLLYLSIVKLEIITLFKYFKILDVFNYIKYYNICSILLIE